jgi:hypothetical protein
MHVRGPTHLQRSHLRLHRLDSTLRLPRPLASFLQLLLTQLHVGRRQVSAPPRLVRRTLHLGKAKLLLLALSLRSLVRGLGLWRGREDAELQVATERCC